MGKSSSSAPAPDPNIGLAQRKLADLSEEYLNFYKNIEYPEQRRLQLAQEARSNEQWQLARDTQEQQNKISRTEYERYQQNIAPLQDRLIQQANQYNTQQNQERIAQQAIGDTAQQYGVARQQIAQQNAAYGIDPTSGRSQALGQQLQLSQAADQAGAANRARSAAEQLGWAKSSDALAASQGVFSNQTTTAQLGLNAGQQALNAGQLGFANALAGQQASQGAYGSARAGWGQVGQLGVSKYQADVNAYAAQQQANATSAAGIGSAVGTLGGIGLKYALGGPAALAVR